MSTNFGATLAKIFEVVEGGTSKFLIGAIDILGFKFVRLGTITRPNIVP